MLLCRTPTDVVKFLSKHKTILDVVTRFRDDSHLFEPEHYLQQFPVLPQKFVGGQDELNPSSNMKEGYADAHLVARAWYSYANEAVPPPNEEPGPAPLDYVDPERKRRLPKQPMLIIFLQGPPRAQSYVAEWQAKEGWFDKTPWIVDQGADRNARWFPNASESQPVKLLPATNSQLAWKTAKDMWEKDGRENGLIISEDRMRVYNERAKVFAAARRVPVGMRPDELRPSEKNDEAMVLGQKAQNALFYHQSNLQVTQFDNFYYSSLVEEKDETIIARRKLFVAEQLRQQQNRPEAIKMYESAFADWKKIIYSPDRDRFRNIDSVQRDIYERHFQYMSLVRERDKVKLVERTHTALRTRRAGCHASEADSKRKRGSCGAAHVSDL